MKKILFICMLCSLLCTACQMSREKSFAKAAEELTKQCPIAIDPNTDLDSLVYNPQDSLYQYYYSLQGASDNDFTNLVTSPLFIERIKENVINSVDMKPYKEYGMTFVYKYYSINSKKLLGTIVITPSDYN